MKLDIETIVSKTICSDLKSIELVHTINVPVHVYCVVLYGSDSIFMPPRFQVEHGLLGNVLCNELGKPEEAKKCWTKATEL